MKDYILVIDEGTTGTRALIYNKKFDIVSQEYVEFAQHTPAENMVEHDAMEIYEKSIKMCKLAMERANINPEDIASIGITNQRATSVIWDRKTGEPIYNAIVWQDTRTADLSEEINKSHWGEKARKSTGWTVSPVYSSLMLKWYLDNVEGLRERMDRKEVLFGTMDTWLLWKLTGGKEHKVGYSNASVMGSLDLVTCKWNEEFLNYLGIPGHVYPEIVNDAGLFGETQKEIFGACIPVHSMIADQHAALFSQGCTEEGTVKCTNGTGTFIDVNVGKECVISDKGINTVVAWKIGDDVTYALEGYAAVTGSAVQWLRDGLRVIESSEETEAIANSVEDSNGVYFIPALAGLSAPYHDPYARGTIFGITRGTKSEHIVRATLEAVAFRCKDICDAVEKDSGVKIVQVKIDGGASKNSFIAQSMADMLDAVVDRPTNIEATSLGCAQMAGLAAGVWNMSDIEASIDIEQTFVSKIDSETRRRRYNDWTKAIERSRGWKL